MRKLRNIHLYMGLTLAPMLLFFAISGAWQALDLHERPKDGSYTPPPIMQVLSHVHTDQRLTATTEMGSKRSQVFQWLSALTGGAIVVLACLGIIMSFRTSRRKWVPTGLLIAGATVPALFILVN